MVKQWGGGEDEVTRGFGWSAGPPEQPGSAAPFGSGAEPGGLRHALRCPQPLCHRPMGPGPRSRRRGGTGRFPLGKTPCVATLHRVFKALDVAAFEEVLREWVKDSGADLGSVVSVDGKTLRGRFTGSQIPGVHLVSAYAADSGAVLTQMATVGKGQELAAAKAAVGADFPGGEDSGGGRTADPTGGVPADCGWRRRLPVAGERESAHVAAGPGGRLFPLWKTEGAKGR